MPSSSAVTSRAVEDACFGIARTAREMFPTFSATPLDVSSWSSSSATERRRVRDDYELVKDMPAPQAPNAGAKRARQGAKTQAKPQQPDDLVSSQEDRAAAEAVKSANRAAAAGSSSQSGGVDSSAGALVPFQEQEKKGILALPARKAPKAIPPQWHAPWKLRRVISGHTGWVRCSAFDVSNEWFATGSVDRTIKIWDLASGTLRLTLTGHIAAVRGLAVSDRHPYMFSAGEDKQVKCWDLEQNKVVRHYHGHLSGIYTLAMHPTVDVIITGGRDSSARVWDIRSKACVHVLAGHSNTVGAISCQGSSPQVITGSHDSTVKLWDLAAGKCYNTLTHHKKSVRSVSIHPTKNLFTSASTDNIKQFKCPEGAFIQNMTVPQEVTNSIDTNSDDVMVQGTDNGRLHFWDHSSAFKYQTLGTTVQPGSLDSEAGIYQCKFDRTGTRLITCEADKTIKIWAQDELATPESHPLNWEPPKGSSGRF